MTVAFANIFMAKREKGIISKSKIKSLVWKRYIDNVFCLWDTKEGNIKEFVTRANHYHDTKIYGWNIRLRNCILGHKSVQRREIQQRLHPRYANALQTNRDLQYTKFLFVSSTRRKVSKTHDEPRFLNTHSFILLITINNIHLNSTVLLTKSDRCKVHY